MTRNRITTKRRNGVGESLTVYFDQNDPQERRALEMAKLLASKHGRRKQAIVALLDAMYTHYQETGELLSTTAIQNAIMNANMNGGKAGRTLNAVVNPDQLELLSPSAPPIQAMQTRARRHRDEPPIQRDDTQLVKVSSGGKASAQETAQNFIQSMSGMSFFD
jgi:hypothetical protein